MPEPDIAGAECQGGSSAVAAPPDDRSALLALRHAGERYRFLDLAYRYLAAIDVDPQMTLEVLKALVEIGLGGPARELLNQRRDLASAGIDPDELRKSLSSVPTGRVPWEELHDQFEANLPLLFRGRPHLAPHERDLGYALRTIQLFRSTDGLLHLSRRETGRLRSWLPHFTDHADANAGKPDAADLREAVLSVGFQLNDIVEHVHAATVARENNQQIPLFLADTEWFRLAAWLHVADRRSIIGDPRVFIFAGPHAAAQYERCLRDHDDLEIPRVRIACYLTDEACRSFDEAGRRARQDRESRCAAVTKRLRERSAGRDQAYWAKRLRPGARVLGFTSQFTTMLQYSMRDIGVALQEQGYEFRMVMEAAPHRQANALTAAKEVETFDPDLVILLNHFRCELPGALMGVPVLTWVQDPTDLVFSKQTGASIGPLDFVCGYYYRRCTEEFGYPRSRFINAVIPVSSRTFHDGPVDPDDETRCACDIMYVGHLHDTLDEHCAKWRSHAAPAIRPLLDRIRDEVTATHRHGAHLQYSGRLVEQVALELGVAIKAPQAEHLALFFAYRLYDILFRRQTLGWVAGWVEQTGRRFRLYGRGWSDDPLLAKYAVGPIEHGEPLRRAYRCAKLVLQMMPSSFMHQRTFEGLASGTLVLGRYSPPSFDNCSIEEFAARHQAGQAGVCAATRFSGLERVTFREESAARHQAGQPGVCAATHFPGLERVTFRNKDEFERLCDHFLEEDDHRQRVLAEHRAIVHDRFTYTAIVPKIVDWIRTHLDAPDDGHHARIVPSHEPSRSGA